MPRILRNLKINEVSGVDKGAGRGVKIMLMKRDGENDIDWSAFKREFSDKERSAAADRGQALPDGSYPIKNVGDLKNAIQAIGRAKNPAKAKAHIKSRARALGRSDLVPDTWKRDGDPAAAALGESIASILADDDLADKRAAISESIRQYSKFVSEENGDMTPEELEAIIAKVVGAELEKAKKKPAPPAADDDGDDDDDDKKPVGKAEVSKASDQKDDHMDKRDDAAATGEIDKRFDELQKRFEEAQKRNTDLEKVCGELLADKRGAEFRKRAIEGGLKEDDGAVMMKAFDGDTEAQTALIKRYSEELKALKSQVKTSVVFGEFGKANVPASSAYQAIEAKAAELRKVDPKLSQAQAFAKAYTDPANRDLVEQEKAEKATHLARLAAGTA